MMNATKVSPNMDPNIRFHQSKRIKTDIKKPSHTMTMQAFMTGNVTGSENVLSDKVNDPAGYWDIRHEFTSRS